MSDQKYTRAEAGRLGARRRWGEPRSVRLDDLTTDQRRLVLALVAAARETKNEPATVSETSAAGSTTGGTRDAIRQS